MNPTQRDDHNFKYGAEYSFSEMWELTKDFKKRIQQPGCYKEELPELLYKRLCRNKSYREGMLDLMEFMQKAMLERMNKCMDFGEQNK